MQNSPARLASGRGWDKDLQIEVLSPVCELALVAGGPAQRLRMTFAIATCIIL
jgi:hypothetical protein